jgi:hypothetical protein
MKAKKIPYGKRNEISISKGLDNFGKSSIGITQLMKDTGADYWKLRQKVKKVI